MQRLKVCRKLMAFVLTLCMVLPLISNQYLVVRAEETDGTTNEKSYMDVDTLAIGKDNKLNWVEGETVTYPISSTENATWNGKVVHIAGLEQGSSYTLKIIRSDSNSETESDGLYLKLKVCSLYNNAMYENTSMDLILNNVYEENYYYLSGGVDYWLNITDNEDKYPTADELNQLTVQVTKSKEFTDDEIPEVTEETTETVKASDYMIGSYKGVEIMGKMYKITLKSGERIKLSSKASDDYSLWFNVWKEKDGELTDCERVTDDGYLMNNTDKDATYYVSSGFMGALAEFTVSFGAKETITIVDIDAADVTAYVAGDSKDLSTEKEQSLRYGKLLYRDLTKEQSNIQTMVTTAHWAKLVVPAGCVYQIAMSGSYGLLKYDADWDVYEQIADELRTQDQKRVGELVEGTYYFYSNQNDAGTITIKDLADVSTISEKAVEITQDDIAKGEVKHENNLSFYKYCTSVLNGKNVYVASCGVLYKITIPAGKCYLVSNDRYNTIVYDDTFTFVGSDGKLSNTGTDAKTFYVWNVTDTYQEDANIRIQSIDTSLEKEKSNAIELKEEVSETYKYSESDAAYHKEMSYTYGSSTNSIEYAKVYKVNPGIYTLGIAANDVNTNAKLYYFETDNLNIKTGDLLDHAAGYYTKLNLNTEKQIPIRALNTGYLVISGDADHLEAAITLTLRKGEDKRLSNNTELVREIYNGYDNECISESAEYTVVCKRDGYNEYAQLGGKWYKYNLDKYTKVEIQMPLCGEMYVFKNTNEPEIKYVETYNADDRYTYTYENNTAESYTLYICVQQNPSYTLTWNKIQVDAYALSDDVSTKENLATEIGATFTTSSDGVYWANVPCSTDDEGHIVDKLEQGKLYKLSVESKNSASIQYDKQQAELAIFDDLTELPIAASDATGKVEFTNLSKEAKTYYLWISGDNENGRGTVTTNALEKKENKSEGTFDTVVPVTGSDAKVTISEKTDSAVATIKAENTNGTGISSNALKESIKIADKYNTDNKDNVNEKVTKVTSIQTTYTDDSADATIAADVVEALKEMDTKVDLEVSKVTADNKVEYTWKMKADSIARAESAAINTKVEVKDKATSDADEQKIKELAGNEEVNKQVVEFAHNGELPAKTEVTVAVDQALNGKTVYYFHFDKANNALVYTGKANVVDGYVTMVLDHCSDYVVFDKNVCSHPTKETKNAIASTCTKEGYSGDKVCKTCGDTIETGETIPAKGHTKSEERKDAKEATCVADGYTGDVYCKDCKELVEKGTVIPKTGKHTAGEWEGEKAATTTEEGSRIKKCTVCGEVVAREAIAKLPAPTPVVTPNVTVSYRTHVQSIGWQGVVTNGTMSGTSGKAKRLEGIEISVAGNSNLGIQYTTHCQSYGWLPWSANGEMNGTEGEAKRLEAIKIQLTGADKDKYNVYYRVHAQSYGWLAWAANGAPAGTAGLAKRLEAIQIVIVKKGESFDHAIGNIQSARGEAYIASSTANANPVVTGENNVNVEYRTHVQSFGWQGWKYNGVMSGTSGKAKRLEGINIKLTNKPYSGSIVYTTHVQSIGWQGNENNVNTWFRDGQMAGTSGRAKRLEAIRIALTGEMAEHYDVYYRVHAQSFGWLDWTKNGEAAGTAGLAKRLEGIQIVLVPKGGAAPARNYGGVVTINNNSYIKR